MNREVTRWGLTATQRRTIDDHQRDEEPLVGSRQEDAMALRMCMALRIRMFMFVALFLVGVTVGAEQLIEAIIG